MKTALKITVSLFLIGAIVWMLGGIREVGAQILRINPLYIIPIVALTMIDRGMMTYKWGLLLRGHGIRLPFFRGMMIYCASAIWGMFLPTTVGADVMRAYSTTRTGIDSREIVASIIVERFVGFLSALILAVLSLGLLTHLGYLGDRVIFAWLLGGGMLLGAVFLFVVSVSERGFLLFHDKVLNGVKHHRVARKIREFHVTYRSFAANRRTLATFLGLTFAEQLLPILDTWLVARGLGIEVGVLYFAAAMPLALLISRLPISIDGIGVFEGMFIVLMSLAGLSAAQAVAIAVVSRILGTITYIPWWFAYVIFSRKLRGSLPLGEENRSNVL
jgi:glycosyltransferase 2 family protein